jgi:hypothetical protein
MRTVAEVSSRPAAAERPSADREQELEERRAQTKKLKGQGVNEESNGGADGDDEDENGGYGSEAEDLLEQATTPE